MAGYSYTLAVGGSPSTGKIRGFKLDPDTHDLVIESGSFVTVSGIDAIGQEIKHRILLFKGEYFLDIRQGLPYYTEILRKGVDVARVREIFRQTIRNVPGIVDVPEVTVDIDRATRHATITWKARAQTGQVVTSEDFDPLIIRL